MTIYIATDHAGFALKEKLVSFLREKGYDVIDCGAETFDPEDDYPRFIEKAARAVSEDPENRKAIILGGSGQGEAMVANRVKGVRATVYYGGNPEIIALSREHNNANVLSLGARFVSEEEAKQSVELWLSLPFTGAQRHTRRIAQIDEIWN